MRVFRSSARTGSKHLTSIESRALAHRQGTYTLNRRKGLGFRICAVSGLLLLVSGLGFRIPLGPLGSRGVSGLGYM